LVATPVDQIGRRVRRELLAGWRALWQGLLVEDPRLCATGAARLAGLGNGLTPAGDDFLMGVIFALWASRPPYKVEPLADSIATSARPHTTRLSGAWLEAAARGEASIRWHRLIDALNGGNQRHIMVAVWRILQVGHTSGADALLGFLLAMGCLLYGRSHD
jgi:hypothetical protein